jgi:hypothetical protein
MLSHQAGQRGFETTQGGRDGNILTELRPRGVIDGDGTMDDLRAASPSDQKRYSANHKRHGSNRGHMVNP